MFTQDQIKQLQQALAALGLYSGKIDGIAGPLTLTGVQKFEAFMIDKPISKQPDNQEDRESIQEAAERPGQINNTLDTPGSDIEEALVFTLKNEGGYVDHPNDPGGATNKGITIGRLSEYLGRAATKDEVKNLSFETIKLIYKKYYWDVLRLDQVLDQSIATAMFDMGVLCGTGTAVRLAQETLKIDNVTKKMDADTLKALNQQTDESFIPGFAEANIDRFNNLVKNNAKLGVFLKGWINRANRLRTLINEDSVEGVTPATAPDSAIGAGLNALAGEVGVTQSSIDRMISWQLQNNPGLNPRYWAVFQIGKHSKEKRLYIFDRVGKTVQSVHATHGEGSDPDHDGVATYFSNTPGSKQSSLGLYKTLGTYIMAKHGRALRLEGLEGTNNNALARGIVFHGVDYADEAYIKANGKCGRSWGCPAVEYAVVQDLIDKLKGGSLLLITEE